MNLRSENERMLNDLNIKRKINERMMKSQEDMNQLNEKSHCKQNEKHELNIQKKVNHPRKELKIIKYLLIVTMVR